MRHNKGANVCFVDGPIEHMFVSQFVDQGYTTSYNYPFYARSY